jgi:hypothetical protein
MLGHWQRLLETIMALVRVVDQDGSWHDESQSEERYK